MLRQSALPLLRAGARPAPSLTRARFSTLPAGRPVLPPNALARAQPLALRSVFLPLALQQAQYKQQQSRSASTLDKASSAASSAASTVSGAASSASSAVSDAAASVTDAVKDTVTGRARGEAKAVAKDFAEIIAGRSVQEAAAGARESAHHQGSVAEDFAAVTKGLFKTVPTPVMNFGLAGTIPYIGTSVGTVFLAREAGIAASGGDTLTGIDMQTALTALHTMEHVQITYGAIILSFLGALHWGMEFSEYGGKFGYQRLAVGTIPVLLAWPTTFLTHGVALAVQWASFTGVWMLDQRASTNGWTPTWYSTYRFYLSIIVGFSIIFTLAGTSYYGVGSGAPLSRTAVPGKPDKTTARTASSMKRLEKVSIKNDPSVSGVQKGKVGGEVAADDLSEEGSGEGYVRVHNREKDEEKAQQEEEEKKAKAEKQDAREQHQSDSAPGTMKNYTKDRTGGEDTEERKDRGNAGQNPVKKD